MNVTWNSPLSYVPVTAVQILVSALTIVYSQCVVHQSQTVERHLDATTNFW